MGPLVEALYEVMVTQPSGPSIRLGLADQFLSWGSSILDLGALTERLSEPLFRRR